MRVRSFAKINLGIEVLRKREDGYHDIRTLFQSVRFFDEIEFRRVPGGRISLRGDRDDVPWDERNLIHRAIRLIQKRTGASEGIEVAVTKRIPPGKGLGGGSSNAAATLWALNDMWGLGLDRRVLMDLGKILGADVPYFLEGGLCLGEERGDRIRPLDDLPPLPCCLLFPPFPIPTAEIYGHYGCGLTSDGEASKMIRFLTSKDFGLLENELETTIFGLYPRLKEFKNLFPREETLLSLVSGSGSAVFGIFESRDRAERFFEDVKTKAEAVLTEMLPRDRYWKELVAGV